MQIKKYNQYKNSGIAWLGEIPAHWQVWKIARAVQRIGSGTTPSSSNSDYYDNGSINWLNTGDFNDGILYECKKKITQKALDETLSLKIFPKGTLSIAMYGATIGKVCIIQFEAATNQACCNIAQGRIFDNKFLMYWFIAHKPHVVNLSYGGGQPNISQEVIKSLHVPCPKMEEQALIVHFLDYKTEQIDRFIHQKKQLIALLNEQKTVIINDAVTKGLNPNAPMKASGIEWLGDVPTHWEVRKLKYSLDLHNGADYKHVESDSGYPVMGSGGQFAFAKEFMFDGEAILLGRKGTIDKPAYFKGKFWAVDTIFYGTGKKNNSVKFLFYVSTRIPFKFYSTATALPSMTQSDLKEHYFAYPPLTEQIAIVAHIESATTQLNEAIATIEKEIALVQEYRIALISEAVTGKISVQ